MTYERQATIAIPERPATEENKAPPLRAGDHLSRAEFERRYQAHPEVKKVELIEGVVYMPSPVRFEQHGLLHFNIIGWLSAYCAATPHVQGGDNVTVLIDYENEVQPDAILRLPARLGGSSQVTADDYVSGPPELVVEVAASSAAYDLHSKRHVYARRGVQEYLAIQVYEQRIDWFALRESVYHPIPTHEDEKESEAGILRSAVFPGLWLQPAALWAGDLAKLLEIGQRGLSSSEHAAFKEKLTRQATESAS